MRSALDNRGSLKQILAVKTSIYQPQCSISASCSVNVSVLHFVSLDPWD